MNAHDALKMTMGTAEFIGLAYLEDLTDDELMRRAAPGINHVNWQVGHLLLSEYQMLEAIAPGSVPPLPAGFAQKYSRETVGIDDPAAFSTKAELLSVYKAQRAGTKAALDKMTAEELDTPAPEAFKAYAPTYGSIFELQGSHWLMHCGQWAVVRRQLGRPALF